MMSSHRQAVASVIVPVFNGASLIERTLDALGAQQLAGGVLEILIVDDGSNDGTGERVADWQNRNPDQTILLLHQENAGPAAARNHGARRATAPLILFTDADCAPAQDWAQNLIDGLQNDVVGVKGTYLSAQKGLIPRFVQAEYEDRYDRMRGVERIDFIDTYSAGYVRSIFLENGGFDETFTTASVEDQELSFRLAAKGYRLRFVPNARVYHLHDANLGEYARRKYWIGFWKALLTRWHPERVVQDSHTPQVLKIQMMLWALIMLLTPAAVAGLFWPPLRSTAWLLWPIVGLFLFSTIPFAVKLARRSVTLTLAAPIILSVRSLALGLGYLIGTIHFAGTPPGEREPIIPGWQRIVKRMMDVVGALVGLLISAPFILLAALVIRLDSPGPVFYIQTRVGEHGRLFRIVKLRSMQADADSRLEQLVDLDALSEPVYKLEDDPRVTRVGRFLRRSSLDETPQFWNVLRGEMSLVGPRPEERRLVARYSDTQRRRLSVKPGITGPMQVSGRGDLSFAERLCLELEYIENYSLRRDIQILLMTFPAVWQGKGAR